LRELGQIPEAAEDGRRCLAVARELGYPCGEAMALGDLSLNAGATGDQSSAVQLARQAAQIQSDVPGGIARACSFVLTQVLIQADDFAAAERACAAALAASRDAGDLRNQENLLFQMTLLDLRAGRTGNAAAHLREALQLSLRAGTWNAFCLDYCGHLCAATGHFAEAITVWAAYATLMPRKDDWPGNARLRQEPLRTAWQALGPSRAQAAEERGAAMSLATAAEYALMLTGPERQQPQASGPGLGQLSVRERELVTLVAQGATNAQIAARLHISVRTVSSHLDRIRDKTGCRRRADLTRLALSADLV
jgi:DNA-binding CsgD family transcriptional regulator